MGRARRSPRAAAVSAVASVCAGACMSLLAGAPSAADPQGIMYTRDVDVVAKSAFVFRGVQRAEETVKLQGELRFNGLHGGAALYQPLDDDFGNETRLFGGWSPHIEDHGSPFDFELGFTWYASPNEGFGTPDASRWEPYAKLFLDAPLAPSLAYYYDIELEQSSLEGRLTHFLPIGALNGLEFGFDGGVVSPENADEHAYAQGSVDLIRNFLNGMEGHVGLRGATSSEKRYFTDVTAAGPAYDEAAKAWLTIGVTSTF